MKKQRGTAVVDVAILAMPFFIFLFACIEFARLMFTLGVLEETTRRAARVAAICGVQQSTIVKNVALFNSINSSSTSGFLLGDLTPVNIELAFLDENLNTVNNPIADVADVFFVQAQIDPANPYEMPLLIPTLGLSITAPPFKTILRSESLGFPAASTCPPP